jgi:hypothetical protein
MIDLHQVIGVVLPIPAAHVEDMGLPPDSRPDARASQTDLFQELTPERGVAVFTWLEALARARPEALRYDQPWPIECTNSTFRSGSTTSALTASRIRRSMT